MEELQIQYLLAGSVSSPAGFLAAAGHAGLRKTSQPDVALVVSPHPVQRGRYVHHQPSGGRTGHEFAAKR
jgi:N-acetylglutamate synthase/N-acetylornithine aminotransferase